MKFTVDDRSTVKKVLHIEVPREDVTKEVEEAYQKLKKTAKIKGFRPGKAPRSLLVRLYQKDVLADVRGKLIQDAFIDALQQSALNMIGSPKIDPPELKENEPYVFEAQVEVPPELADIEMRGLALKKTKYRISDQEVDKQLALLRKNLAQRRVIDPPRPVQSGDIVVIDYEGFKDGQSHEQTAKTENFVTQVGEGQIVGDLDQGLIGMQVGDEKEIDVAFPEDYFSKALAGQKLVFKVKLNEIREEILPELDDQLAKNIGSQFETLDDLKQKIRENLQGGYDKRIEQELNEQIFQQILAKISFEVPEALVESELEQILNDAEQKFAHSNRKLEDVGLTREMLSQRYRATAEKQVRRHLILSKLIDQEKLTLTEDEVDKGFQDMADLYHQPVDQIRAYYNQNKEGLSFFKHTLLEKKALALIIENSSIEEVEPTENLGPTGAADVDAAAS
jgi:trigger factor